MVGKNKIPCRVCGKLFIPCAYCQSHTDVFRWRNFACSKECAVKYVNDAIAYRESQKNKDWTEEQHEGAETEPSNDNVMVIDNEKTGGETHIDKTTPRKKSKKNISIEIEGAESGLSEPTFK